MNSITASIYSLDKVLQASRQTKACRSGSVLMLKHHHELLRTVGSVQNLANSVAGFIDHQIHTPPEFMFAVATNCCR